MKRYIYGSLVAIASALALSSCSEEKLSDNSVFPDIDESLDPTSFTYKFDKWIDENYCQPYNMKFVYKMEHLGTDMNYNLVPATLDKSMELAVLTKYLWYDVYAELVGPDFLRQYGPKIIHLIGSSAVNPTSGTEILGLAEGGLKVSLFKVNALDPTDAEQLNEKYFKTMHHEFSHILHQTKTYPKEFNLLNSADYEPTGWQDRNGATVASLGFTTCYASMQAREDFAETLANYITRTDDQWEMTLWMADRGWYETDDYETVTWVQSNAYTSWAKSLAFSYYYYENDANRENDVRTYVGSFTERDQVYYLTDLQARFDADGTSKGCKGGSRRFDTVADMEAFLQSLRDQGYVLTPVEDRDGKKGGENIRQKVSIGREWFESAWNLDLDRLREEVQYRQSHIDLPALLSAIENIQ